MSKRKKRKLNTDMTGPIETAPDAVSESMIGESPAETYVEEELKMEEFSEGEIPSADLPPAEASAIENAVPVNQVPADQVSADQIPAGEVSVNKAPVKKVSAKKASGTESRVRSPKEYGTEEGSVRRSRKASYRYLEPEEEESYYASPYPEDDEEEEDDYNRSGVNRIKKAIILTLLLMFLIPTVLCVVMLFKMHGMQVEMDELHQELLSRRKQQEEILASENTTEDLAALEASAYGDIEKDKKANAVVLHQSQPEEPTAVLSKQAMEEGASEQTSDTSTEEVPDDGRPENWNGKKVYLTFDDGPSAASGQLLDILKRYDVKATFFMVLKDTSQQAIIERMVSEGHTLGIHSASHEYGKIYASLDAFIEDVTKVHDLLYEMTGQDVRYYRFPGGSSNRVSDVDIYECIAYLNEAGYTYFDWNALNEDAEASYTDPITLNANVMRYVRNNSGDSIVLMHDLEGHPETLESLPNLIETLQTAGYWILPIDDTTEAVQHRYIREETEDLSVDSTAAAAGTQNNAEAAVGEE